MKPLTKTKGTETKPTDKRQKGRRAQPLRMLAPEKSVAKATKDEFGGGRAKTEVPRNRETATDVPIPIPERGSYDGDTAIKLYLREIGQVKLLTPQEEIEL